MIELILERFNILKTLFVIKGLFRSQTINCEWPHIQSIVTCQYDMSSVWRMAGGDKLCLLTMNNIY